MHKITALIVSGLAASAFLSASAFAGDDKFDPKKPLKDPVEAKAVKGKSGVKVTGDQTKNGGAAIEKKAGAYSCDIHVDNRTNLYVNRVYIDGRNWGSVGRGGDSIFRDVSTGATTVYAELDYTDGSTSHYGPVLFKCESYTTHRWVLR